MFADGEHAVRGDHTTQNLPHVNLREARSSAAVAAAVDRKGWEGYA